MLSASSSEDDGIIHITFSYDTNIMLAAIVSLLVVVLFVLLLHIYAKWFLAQAHHRGGTSVPVPQVLGARFHTLTVDTNSAISPSKGLESSTISSIPLFVFKAEEHKHGLECVICLSLFEDEEVGRRLPKCDHAFHVECIDMWLHSHTTCPICRAPVLSDTTNSADSSSPQNEEILNQWLSETNLNELRISNADSILEIIVADSNSEIENVKISDSSSSIGSSLKRMFSRNKSERKFDLPSDGNESNI
ncbi:RING-H2 finger protein ATL63-like [Olea europaea var. sylvestris]|uniref:RING-type E3 ubiquitin transferase n=1 Tax=Olea europaea subsp. europaea TaxID=158383 RepID=A0A8S0R3F9_OLEEU|nr:RING-H2 finger protein ATL63-like [Olea europaea var. sylvestris]CAA2973859.1 RING-H2 finger ATL63-like [Olea europaea subsp. europaea]